MELLVGSTHAQPIYTPSKIQVYPWQELKCEIRKLPTVSSKVDLRVLNGGWVHCNSVFCVRALFPLKDEDGAWSLVLPLLQNGTQQGHYFYWLNSLFQNSTPFCPSRLDSIGFDKWFLGKYLNNWIFQSFRNHTRNMYGFCLFMGRAGPSWGSPLWPDFRNIVPYPAAQARHWPFHLA